jgi:LPXTG-site transpeptidase (sortase) family protein
MRPKGLIYQLGKSGTHGEIILILPLLVKLAYHLVRTLGAATLAFAILTLMFSFGPIFEQEVNYRLNKNTPVEQKYDFSPQIAEAQRVVQVQKEALDYGVSSYFSVVIPKINASSNVIANVDVSKKQEYLEALQKGVAHAKGTSFPGQNGSIFLFSHSTDSPLNFARYNAIFYLLKELEKGDKIIIFFADKKYEYEVEDKFMAQPADTSWLTSGESEEKLILMTCDPPGTTWRRLLISAKPVN